MKRAFMDTDLCHLHGWVRLRNVIFLSYNIIAYGSIAEDVVNSGMSGLDINS
jgi:hypothetical protein